jgi:hypothetical protein
LRRKFRQNASSDTLADVEPDHVASNRTVHLVGEGETLLTRGAVTDRVESQIAALERRAEGVDLLVRSCANTRGLVL